MLGQATAICLAIGKRQVLGQSSSPRNVAVADRFRQPPTFMRRISTLAPNLLRHLGAPTKWPLLARQLPGSN